MTAFPLCCIAAIYNSVMRGLDPRIAKGTRRSG